MSAPFTEAEISAEVWRDIPGYEGGFQASDLGRIRSRWLHGNVRRLGLEWKILAPMTIQSGHLVVGLFQRMTRVHRLVLLTFVGPAPAGCECRHLDGDPTNNRLANLRWGTRAENMADRAVHGTSNRGERNGMARLRNADVVEIRRRHGNGETKKAIAADYGITTARVLLIVARRIFRHV